MVLVTDRLL